MSSVNVWNGSIIKHRDFQHDSFFDHVKENGSISILGEINVTRNPLTWRQLSSIIVMWLVYVDLHGGTQIDINSSADGLLYLIHSDEEPSDKKIKEELDKYITTRLDHPRDIEQCVEDIEVLREMIRQYNDRVAA